MLVDLLIQNNVAHHQSLTQIILHYDIYSEELDKLDNPDSSIDEYKEFISLLSGYKILADKEFQSFL